jgi:hypothetical protein
MRTSYDFLPPEEREWVERCQSLAVVFLFVVLALAASFAFAQDARAQTCSGGASGGMDASGCDCNMPSAIDTSTKQATSGVLSAAKLTVPAKPSRRPLPVEPVTSASPPAPAPAPRRAPAIAARSASPRSIAIASGLAPS